MRNFKCPDCGFKGKNERSIKTHRRIMHKNSDIPLNQEEQPIQPQEELVIITLKHTITVNGKRYSGTVTVSPSMAQDLRYRDSRATHAEWREHHGTGNINDKTPLGQHLGVIR